MKTEHCFKVELSPKPDFYKFKYFKGQITLYFNSIPTREEALAVFDAERKRYKEEHDWVNRKYKLDKFIKENKQELKERVKFDKACRDLLEKYGVSDVRNWKHTGAISNVQDEGTVRVSLKTVYRVKKKKISF